MLIDAHCHIDQFPDPLALARQCEAEGVTTVAVTNLPGHFELARPHIGEMRFVKLALGLHPLAVGESKRELPRFLDLISEAGFIGEIGLDFSKEGISSKAGQMAVFERIVESISQTKKFVTLHSRCAAEQVLNVLEAYDFNSAILHWFTGSSASLDRAIEFGCWFSVNPAMIRSKSGMAILGRLPRDRVLTETDGPHVKLGSRSAVPSDVQDVLRALALTWGINQSEAEDLVADNFARLAS